MESSNALQQAFFQRIKMQMPPHLSFVDEIAELLKVSNDSAYRRIRGEKPISFEETKKLSAHFKVSIDQLLNLSSDTSTFTTKYVTPDNFDLDKYLEQQLKDLQYIASFKVKEITYQSKDIPVFHYFSFPELASMKYFFWMKVLLQFPELANKTFSFDFLRKPIQEMGKKVISTYNTIPAVEIMSIENINTTLRQIEYLKETYTIGETELAIVYDQLHEMTDHLSKQTEAGFKFLPGEKPTANSPVYQVYINDFVIGDNSIIVKMDDNRASFFVHNHLSYLMITDPRFTSYHYNFIQNVIRKSILISSTGEKYRARFFYLIHEKIEQCRNNKMQLIGKL